MIKIRIFSAAAACFYFLCMALLRPAGVLAGDEADNRYIVLAWSALGMHWYNDDYQDMAIMPPYNTLWAQVIKTGAEPEIVTSGVIVEYAFNDNTYSAGKRDRPDKTNFWRYAGSLFGRYIETDKGLTGKGLSGFMDAEGDHFVAEGIPLTEYRDQDAVPADAGSWERHPYQMAEITVKDARSGAVLCRVSAVAPVSSEMNCGKCHGDNGPAVKQGLIQPQGRVGANIVALHDALNRGRYRGALSQRRPVLCAECHASYPLKKKGVSGVPSLSKAMHSRHRFVPGITTDTDGCYSCHPGDRTRCLRDTMSANYRLDCVNCHGMMENVARNRLPWRLEPRCDAASCLGGGDAQDHPLYTRSKAHHGKVYCAGCHDSPHAIAPSSHENDSRKFMDLQGDPRTLRDCAVCHGSAGQRAFSH